MRYFFFLFLLAMAHTTLARAQNTDSHPMEEEDESVVLPAITESGSVLIAFYVSASGSLVRAMRKAAKEACAAADGKIVRSYGSNLPEAKLYWLCDGSRLQFFRGIGIDGEKVKDGFICSAKESHVGFKYNMAHMFTYARDCVGVGENSETGRLEIYVDHSRGLCPC